MVAMDIMVVMAMIIIVVTLRYKLEKRLRSVHCGGKSFAILAMILTKTISYKQNSTNT